jgi:hypothetical protein
MKSCAVFASEELPSGDLSPPVPCGGKDIYMNLDKNSLNMLLSLDDAHLSVVIRQLAAGAGIPAESLNLGPNELKGIRQALSIATDGDISRAAELIKSYKQGKKG